MVEPATVNSEISFLTFGAGTPEWKWNKADCVERLGLTPEHLLSPKL